MDLLKNEFGGSPRSSIHFARTTAHSGIFERQTAESFDERQHRNLFVHKPGHWCSLGLASENTWWNANSGEPQGKLDIFSLQMVDIFKCDTSHPIFPTTVPLSLGHSRKGAQSNLPVLRNWKSGTHTENSKSISNPSC